MRIIAVLFGGATLLVSIVTFGYGVFTLVMAESSSTSFSTVRVDPTFAIAWLLVSLITGLFGYAIIKEN